MTVDPMRIAMVRVSRTIRGAETQMLALSAALAERGHEILVVTREHSSLIEMAEQHGLRAVGLAISGDLNIRAPSRIARLLRSEGIEVVNAHGSHGSLACCLAARRARVPVVATFHTPVIGDAVSGRKPRRALLGRLTRPALMLADRVIAVSECSRRYLLALGFAEDHVETVHNGIDLRRYREADRAAARRELGVGDREVLFGFLGRLIEDKRPDLVLRAMKELARGLPVRAFIAGEGPLRRRLSDLAAELDLGDRIMLTGFRSDTAALLAASDCLVAPSVREGLPIVLLEAMAAGRPVIASAVGGVPELVVDGECGRLLTPDDLGGLVRAMRELAESPELRAEMGGAGQARVARGFTVTGNAGRVEAVLRRVMAAD